MFFSIFQLSKNFERFYVNQESEEKEGREVGQVRLQGSKVEKGRDGGKLRPYGNFFKLGVYVVLCWFVSWANGNRHSRPD